MHGLDNGFVVVSTIEQNFDPLAAPLAQWADRYRDVGFDQFLVVEKPSSDAVDFWCHIFNADGQEIEQHGNGTRCFVCFVTDKGLTDKTEILVEAAKGIIVPRLLDNGLTTVNMGKPRFMPSEIPFVPAHGKAEDTPARIVLASLESVSVSCVNMDNPHAIISIDNVETAPADHWGSIVESYGQFPERVNVGFMQIEDELSIRLRVSECRVEEIQVCGIGTCAAVMTGVRNGLLKANVPVHVALPGGELLIGWEEGDDVQMTGLTEAVFEDELQYS